MEKPDKYLNDTKKLKELIRQVDKSGLSAWIAGNKLSAIKDTKSYKNYYNNFSEYCNNEFNISISTASTYIKIFRTFTENEVTHLFISHLKLIGDLIDEPKSRSLIVETISDYSGDINKEDIVTLASFVNSIKIFDTNQVIKLTEILVENNLDKKRKKEIGKKVVKFGKPLSSKFISELLMEKEPINEMGVVGLFCLIFPYLKKYFNLKGEKIAFKSIKYIQAPFPDACILCQVKDNKKTETELLIEFEFESFEYIRHKHHLSDKKCDMIICWQDNAKTKKSREGMEVVRKMPPVFELKEFLETGNIELID